MGSTILGPIGKTIAWIIFLYISYASLIAYTAAGGSLMVFGGKSLLSLAISKQAGCMIFLLLFGSVVYLGNKFVGRINTILFIALIGAYIALMGTGLGEVKQSLLFYQNWSTAYLAIPLLLTTFSFQTMLPSLTPYLKKNVLALRLAIIGGTTLTLVVYLLWQGLVLGIVPLQGSYSLIDALVMGEPVTQFLRQHVTSQSVSAIAEYFAFFALVTSFLGIALGLLDFLSDGLKIKKKGMGNVLLTFLIVVPVYVFSAYYERVFLVALETTGGFGDSILNGIIPVIMVWIGRYHANFPATYRVWGGKPLLILVLSFFVLSLILETLMSTGWICSVVDSCEIFRQEISTTNLAFH